MKDYNDSSWLENNVWGKWGADDEIGALNEVTPEDIVRASSLIKTGKVYDLETTRFKGNPVWPGHIGFELLTYASPKGRRNLRSTDYDSAYAWMNEGGWLDDEKNTYKIAANTEAIIAPLHMGTHIDGFCHVTIGEDAHWYNGFNENEHWSDFGPLKTDASTIPPIILRGVLLDVAGCKGLDHLPPNYGITAQDLEDCVNWEGIELKKNDCVLVRTGERWPQGDLCPNAGLTIESARYLIEGHSAVLMGNDQTAFESVPSPPWPDHLHPVHHYCLTQQGVHFIELVQMDELAKDKCYEFCFMLASNKIRGGTGMFVRPLAIC